VVSKKKKQKPDAFSKLPRSFGAVFESGEKFMTQITIAECSSSHSSPALAPLGGGDEIHCTRRFRLGQFRVARDRASAKSDRARQPPVVNIPRRPANAASFPGRAALLAARVAI